MHTLEPKRDPRPRTDDGTYLCYRESCECEADVATPRRIEAEEGPDPVETVVTFCLQDYLANRVLRQTCQPLEAAVSVQETLEDEMDSEGWAPLRVEARALANLLLYDDPLGRDPPDEDSPLGDMLDHAGDAGSDLRKRIETSVEAQLYEYDAIDDDSIRPGDEASLEDF